MVFPVKFMIIIYISVFILAKLFYCIDVGNETSTTVGNGTVVKAQNTNATQTTETSPSDQLDSTTQQPLENGNVMQICNQTFPTPKGTLQLCIYLCVKFMLGFIVQDESCADSKIRWYQVFAMREIATTKKSNNLLLHEKSS